MGGRLAIGWIICAVTFVAMGLFPMIFILKTFFESWMKRTQGMEGNSAYQPSHGSEVSWGLSLFLQAVSAAGGIIAGIMLFRMVAS
jgi:hypothetical protein